MGANPLSCKQLCNLVSRLVKLFILMLVLGVVWGVDILRRLVDRILCSRIGVIEYRFRARLLLEFSSCGVLRVPLSCCVWALIVRKFGVHCFRDVRLVCMDLSRSYYASAAI